MKKFIIVEAVSDDDGNFYADVEGIFDSEDEAKKHLKKRHDEVMTYFNDPDDGEYEEDDSYWDISENDDIEIRRVMSIREVEM